MWTHDPVEGQRSWLCVASSDTTLAGAGEMTHFCSGGGRVESRPPTGLCGWDWVGPPFCLWCLAEEDWLLHKSFPSWETAPFLAFWVKRGDFCRSCFGCVHWYFGLSASSVPVWDLWGKKKTQGACHCVIPYVPRSLSSLLFSPHFSGSSGACFICKAQMFQLSTVGKWGKYFSTFPEPAMWTWKF